MRPAERTVALQLEGDVEERVDFVLGPLRQVDEVTAAKVGLHVPTYSMAPRTSESSAIRMTTPLNASYQYQLCLVLSTSGGSSSIRGSECRMMAELFALSRSSSRVTRHAAGVMPRSPPASTRAWV